MKLFRFSSLQDRDARRMASERAYLDESVSLYDVERRQREIAAGKFRG